MPYGFRAQGRGPACKKGRVGDNPGATSFGPTPKPLILKETTGGEFRVHRATIRKASIRYIDLLEGFYNGNYPPEIVPDYNPT